MNIMGLELGTALTISTLVGTAASVGGQIMQANAANEAAQYQAQIARNNQQIAANNAMIVQQQADQEAARVSAAAGQRRGKMLAQMGASGVDIGSGSFSDVLSSQEEADRMSTLNTRSSGTARAFEMLNQANNFGAEATLRERSGANAMAALPFQVGGTVAGAVSNFAPRWREMERNR
jgi:phosphopantothenoylcysteine synthetase/decarboxylase